MYNTLKEMHPSGNFTIHSWHPDYWYNLLSTQKRIAKNKSDDNKPIEIDLMPSMSTEERSERESAKTKNKINPVIQEEGSTSIYPNRIEKVGKKIKIHFSGNYIEPEKETLDGLKYIYFLVKNTTESSPLTANELYKILKPQSKQKSYTDSDETQNTIPLQKPQNTNKWNEEDEGISEDDDGDLTQEDDENNLPQERFNMYSRFFNA